MGSEELQRAYAPVRHDVAAALAANPAELAAMRRLAEDSGLEQAFNNDVLQLLHDYHNRQSVPVTVGTTAEK